MDIVDLENNADAARPASDLLGQLRPEAAHSPDSGIYEIVDHARGRTGILPMWVGEGDLPTPSFIADAAARSLSAGETFYTDQRGIPDLRAALAAYHTRFYERPFPAERFFVTGSGMQAMQITARMVAGVGDEVVVPTPSWPNITAAVGVAGARAVQVPLRFTPSGWQLDLDQLFDAVGPRTRALFINSPANPTGWTATADQIAAILEFCQRRGVWIIADEVYHRFHFGPGRAPSFYDQADPDAMVIYINTFSKNWAMTGWRVGWISAPPVLGQVIENLIQYATSGVAVFMQRAATTALDDGDGFIAEQVGRAALGRRIVCDGLRATGRVRLAEPAGAFYLLFGIEGQNDALALAKRLIDEASVGLAPGPAFGAGGEGFLRLCFARNPDSLSEAVRRLQAWIASA
jgi:aspartate/methionine/tyrosine aminotransferase